jgi:cell division protein ZapA
VSEPVTVHILEREYLVACPPDERPALMTASQLLDSRMREVRGGNRMASIDRIAVLAALNIAAEFIKLKQDAGERDRDLSRTLGELNRRLDGLLDVTSSR